VKIITFDGNCARMPTKGKAQSNAKPVRAMRTARVVRAEIGCEESVFMGFGRLTGDFSRN